MKRTETENRVSRAKLFLKRFDISFQKVPLCFIMLVCPTLIFVSCIGSKPQFEKMPQGPLISYAYSSWHRTGGGSILVDIHIWHDENGQGLMTYEGTSVPVIEGQEIPQPIVISESVFDTVYLYIEKGELYKLKPDYGKTYFVDAYAYPAWSLKANFPNDSIETVSEGKDADMDSDKFYLANRYLEKVFNEELKKWLDKHAPAN